MSTRDLTLSYYSAKLVLVTTTTAANLDFKRGTAPVPSTAKGILLYGILRGFNADAPNLAVTPQDFHLRMKRGLTAAAAATVLYSVWNRTRTEHWIEFPVPLRLNFTDNEPEIRISLTTGAIATNDYVYDFFYNVL